MNAFLLRLLAFLAIAHVLRGFQISGVGAAVVGALVYGIATGVVRVLGLIALLAPAWPPDPLRRPVGACLESRVVG